MCYLSSGNQAIKKWTQNPLELMRASVWLVCWISKKQLWVPAPSLINCPFLFIRSMKDTLGIIRVQIQSMIRSGTEVRKRCCVHIQPNSDLMCTHPAPSNPWTVWRSSLEYVLYLNRLYQSNEQLCCSWKKQDYPVQNTCSEGIREWKNPRHLKFNSESLFIL